MPGAAGPSSLINQLLSENSSVLLDLLRSWQQPPYTAVTSMAATCGTCMGLGQYSAIKHGTLV